MKRLLLSLGFFAVGCTSAPTTVDPPPLVTRQSEPLVPRPKRMGAIRFEVSDVTDSALEEMLLTESDSNEVLFVTGLRWNDGHETAAVVHVRYPPEDMAENEYEAAVDDSILERCDSEFQACVDGVDGCREEAYESCIRTAYRDPFVYMSSHLGIDCGILELSMYTLENSQPTLSNRRRIESMVCDVDYSDTTPAAADLDGDGGPELVYTWSSTQETSWNHSTVTDSLLIVDANDLHDQFRLSRESFEDSDYDNQQFSGVSTVDPDGDGFFDLRVNVVQQTGYCEDFGWSLGARFVIPEDADEDDEACRVEIEQAGRAYDPGTDVWGPAKGESK